MDEENQGSAPQDDIIDFGGDEGGEQLYELQAEPSGSDADEYKTDDAPQNASDDDPDEEWEAGGQTFKVKKSELRAGYMKDADYRQKTAKAAEQQKFRDSVTRQANDDRQSLAGAGDGRGADGLRRHRQAAWRRGAPLRR